MYFLLTNSLTRRQLKHIQRDEALRNGKKKYLMVRIDRRPTEVTYESRNQYGAKERQRE